jgi:hypothetical protein
MRQQYNLFFFEKTQRNLWYCKVRNRDWKANRDDSENIPNGIQKKTGLLPFSRFLVIRSAQKNHLANWRGLYVPWSLKDMSGLSIKDLKIKNMYKI